MFSRVSQALSEFIKPIASSTSQEASGQSPQFERAAFPRSRPQERSPSENGKQAPAPVIRLPDPEKKAESTPQNTVAGTNVTVPQAFVLFFREFRQRRHDIMKWMGNRVYSASAQGRPRGYSKGAMLDRKAG